MIRTATCEKQQNKIPTKRCQVKNNRDLPINKTSTRVLFPIEEHLASELGIRPIKIEKIKLEPSNQDFFTAKRYNNVKTNECLSEIVYAPIGSTVSSNINGINVSGQRIILNISASDHFIRITVPTRILIAKTPYISELCIESSGGNIELNDFAFEYIQNFLLNPNDVHCLKHNNILNCISEHLAQLFITSLETEANNHKARGSRSCIRLRQRIKKYIHENLNNPKITPKIIAAECGISVSYLHKIFNTFGTPVNRWIMQSRLELCKNRLTEASYRHISISSIAYDAGFNNQAHFSTKFKGYFGKSPREMRRDAINSI